MSRPPLEVADIIRAAGEAFIERNRHWLRWKHVKVLRAIERCRTAALGGHRNYLAKRTSECLVFVVIVGNLVTITSN